MSRMSKVIESRRLAVFEALAMHSDTGLTKPAIVKASGVPRSTIPRIIKRFEKLGVVRKMGRVRKADIYRLNGANKDVARLLNAVLTYSSNAIRDAVPRAAVGRALSKAVAEPFLEADVFSVPIAAVARRADAKPTARDFVIYANTMFATAAPAKQMNTGPKQTKGTKLIEVDLDELLSGPSAAAMQRAAGAA